MVAFTVWINVLIMFIMFMINSLSVCLSLINNGFSWNFSHWDALCTGKQLIKIKLEFLSNIWFQIPEELRQKLEKKGHEAAERRRDVVHQKSAKARPKTVKVLVGMITSWHVKMHVCWQELEFWTWLLIGWLLCCQPIRNQVRKLKGF